jgi:hypothetical protein
VSVAILAIDDMSGNDSASIIINEKTLTPCEIAEAEGTGECLMLCYPGLE